MRIRSLHRWDVSPREAARLQRRLASEVIESSGSLRLERVAAADVSYDRARDLTVAGVACFTFPELALEEEHLAEGRIPFPYVPGLLSFREAPLVLDCFRKLRRAPDIVLLDGHGRAHPRRFGLACHIGLCLDVATIGCAKSRLCGQHDPPGPARGATAPVRDDGSVIGLALRSRPGTLPIYVSIGHRIDLPRAAEIVLACCRGYKHPEPLRHVDRRVGESRRRLVERKTRA